MNALDLGRYLKTINYTFHNIHEFRAYIEAARMYCNGLKYYMYKSNIKEKYVTMKVTTDDHFSWYVDVYL